MSYELPQSLNVNRVVHVMLCAQLVCYCIQCTLIYSVHCTMYSVHCTVYNVQYTLYNVWRLQQYKYNYYVICKALYTVYNNTTYHYIPLR